MTARGLRIMPRHPAATARRLAVFGASLATTGFGAVAMQSVLATNGTTPFEWTLLLLFTLNFAWIALSFWTAVPGFLVLLFHWRQPGLAQPDAAAEARPLASRTAILMPVYNEATSGIYANLEAIWRSLQRTGHADAFDIFVLSDTTDPDLWVAEELGWNAFCGRVGGHGRIFYRKRRHNVAKKAGNIADFCTRWGMQYDFMVVLDADSLMTGDVLVRMVRLMEANPDAGIIQAPPLVVNRNTLWARMQQFAGRAYGPVVAAGLAFWQLGDGNYWGHNAIIRTRAFIESCGLPVLAGPPPFGGHILSHDFVEAALIRRNGWKAWLVPELGGSYEECPPTMVDHAKRDRRWCQGNMQHLRILAARGLHPLSRLHMAMGVMSYLSSPLWLVFIAAGLVVTLEQSLIPPRYFPDTQTLFPIWPVTEIDLAIRVLAVSFGMLLAPKLFGWILIATDRRLAAGFGGRLAALGSVLFETLLSILTAPVMMLFHSSFVLAALLGRDTGWGSQSRDDRGTRWGDALRLHGTHTLFGIVLGLAAGWISTDLVLWLSPLIAGLVLSVPVSVLTSRASVGLWARRHGLLVTPEETNPPAVLVEAGRIARALETRLPRIEDGLERLIRDPLANAIHIALLPGSGGGPEDPALVREARRRLLLAEEQRPPGRPATHALSRAQKTALMFDAATLTELHLRALARAG